MTCGCCGQQIRDCTISKLQIVYESGTLSYGIWDGIHPVSSRGKVNEGSGQSPPEAGAF